jgi:hypothetical protein
MVNFKDPVVISRDFCTYEVIKRLELDELVCLSTVVMVKLWHTLDGLYMYLWPKFLAPLGL